MNAISIYKRGADAAAAGALDAETTNTVGRIVSIETESISPDPSQPRKNFEGESIARLADSIRRYGILQPLTVIPSSSGDSSDDNELLSSDAVPRGKRYELVAGRRRLEAARAIGLEKVPCIIFDGEGSDGSRRLELALTENLQREELNLFEQAGAIASLIDVYSLTQEQAASRLSVSQSYIANKLRILRLTEPERRLILEHGLTERHARALLRVKPPEERLRALRFVVHEELNVSATEEYIDRLFGRAEYAARNGNGHRRFILKDIRLFYNAIDRALDTVRSAGYAVSAMRRETERGVELTIVVPKANNY